MVRKARDAQRPEDRLHSHPGSDILAQSSAWPAACCDWNLQPHPLSSRAARAPCHHQATSHGLVLGKLDASFETARALF